MHGIGFEYDLQEWFDFKIPDTKITSNYIYNCLQNEKQFKTKPNAKVIWLGGKPQTGIFTKSKKGNSWEMLKLSFHSKTQKLDISINADEGKWLVYIFEKISVYSENKITYSQFKADFESHFEDFELFWFSKPMKQLRQIGLVVV